MRAFAVDLTATQTALLLGLDRKTINRYYGLFRAAIHAHQSRQIAALVGVIECDESYFGRERPRLRGPSTPRGRSGPKSSLYSAFPNVAAASSPRSCQT